MKKVNLIALLIVIFTVNNVASQTWDGKFQSPTLNDKFRLGAGIYIPVKSVLLSANGSLPNEDIDFGDSFGLDDREVTPYLNFYWRFAKMWLLGAEYFKVKSDGESILDEDITWEDHVFK